MKTNYTCARALLLWITSLFLSGPLPLLWAEEAPARVALSVPAGAPLRLYLTRRMPKKMGAEVEAKVLEPVYSFDRLVVPAGTVVLGRVTGIEPVSKSRRARAILGGDFTPLKEASVDFTTVVLPDGSRLSVHTSPAIGLTSIVPDKPPRKHPSTGQKGSGLMAAGKQKVYDAVNAQVDQFRSISDMVRSPDKKELAENYIVSKLPYHSQSVRRGTRFDAELVEPLEFGSELVATETLRTIGTQPPTDSVARVRLLTPLDSKTSKQGDLVEALLSTPLYTTDRKLVLPEGTMLHGSLLVSRKARMFHRGGQLRFNFREIELPQEISRLRTQVLGSGAAGSEDSTRAGNVARTPSFNLRMQASVRATESTGTPLSVDDEGGVQVKQSKFRLVGVAASLLIARTAADNDVLRSQAGKIAGEDSNVGGRTAGGALGFGIIGAAASQSSRYVGMGLGYYGLGWSLYSTVIARGQEVQFPKNAMVDIRFNTRPDAHASSAAKPSRQKGAAPNPER